MFRQTNIRMRSVPVPDEKLIPSTIQLDQRFVLKQRRGYKPQEPNTEGRLVEDTVLALMLFLGRVQKVQSPLWVGTAKLSV
jgi:hypothetical protein